MPHYHSGNQYTNSKSLQTSHIYTSLCTLHYTLRPSCRKLIRPYTMHTAKPHFCNTFSFSALVNEVCSHLPQSLTVSEKSEKRDQLFRSASATMLPDDTKQTGTKGPAWQGTPSCHPAQNAAKMDQPQQLHRTVYGNEDSHRITDLTLNVRGFHSPNHV